MLSFGDQVRNCGIMGDWRGSAPICKRKSCLPSEFTLIWKLGSFYFLHVFFQRPPISVIDCGFPEFLENGFVTHSDTLYGAEASYWCRRGFRLINGDSSQKCTRAGVWSGRKPICKGFHSSIYINFGQSFF